ncbi:hypothetical protein [Streptosporangium sp. NPDC051022]|uniref:hypothetical protein n=1 Tax=Streptosporangium sp. NPDC051022 TaxID=3155752 RepID=UPI003427B471
MIPARYRSRPVEPTQVEALLLTEDNLQEVADWWNDFPASTLTRHGRATVDTYEDFHRTFETHTPDDPSLCSCLTPVGEGTAKDNGPLVWEPDCKRCGRPLTQEALDSLKGQA